MTVIVAIVVIVSNIKYSNKEIKFELVILLSVEVMSKFALIRYRSGFRRLDLVSRKDKASCSEFCEFMHGSGRYCF